MPTDTALGSRIIQIQQNIIGPGEPRKKTVLPRKISDFAGVPPVYLKAAQKYSNPFLMGPPLCDELVALVKHMFTEEDADIFLRLGITGKTVRQVSAAAHRSIEDVQPILNRLALEKHFIGSSGPKNGKKYAMMPLMPGVFEMCLIRPSLDSLTEWHRRFAELFEAMYETGYMVDYAREKSTPFVRYIPINQMINADPMALPTDKLEMILDKFKVFGVGICQCRLTMEITGRGCGKPKFNCTIMGELAEKLIAMGKVQKVTKQEVLEIKYEAESHGMVNWMLNIENTKTQSSCSCCGCCCHNFRTITEYNTPNLIAPPHFLPKINIPICTCCGLCAKKCPMAAITVNTKEKKYSHNVERCIGCGLCVANCTKVKAIKMEPVPAYRLPYKNWVTMTAREMPGYLMNAWRIKRERSRNDQTSI